MLCSAKKTTNIICGCCPHPRAPGALALSLDREVEMDTEMESKNSQTRRMTVKSLRGVKPTVPRADFQNDPRAGFSYVADCAKPR
jgi:hypothetical protein